MPVCRDGLGRYFGLSDAVQQVHQVVVVDAGMLGQADFAGAAGGNAFVANLYRLFQAAQRVGIQLRVVKPLSPAKPQQWMPSGMTNCWVQRRTISIRPWASPRCWVLQVTCTAMGCTCWLNVSRSSKWVR